MKNTSTRMTLGRGLAKLPTAVEIKNICLIRNKANWNCNRFVCWIGFCCLSILCCCLSSGWMFQAGTVGLFVDVADFDVVAAAAICYVTNVTYIHTLYVHRQQTGTSCIYKQRKIPLAMQRRCEWQATSRENTHTLKAMHTRTRMHKNVHVCVCGKVARTRLTLLGQSANGGDWQKRGGMSWACCMPEAHSRTADSERRSHQKRMHQLPSSSRYMFN